MKLSIDQGLKTETDYWPLTQQSRNFQKLRKWTKNCEKKIFCNQIKRHFWTVVYIVVVPKVWRITEIILTNWEGDAFNEMKWISCFFVISSWRLPWAIGQNFFSRFPTENPHPILSYSVFWLSSKSSRMLKPKVTSCVSISPFDSISMLKRCIMIWKKDSRKS